MQIRPYQPDDAARAVAFINGNVALDDTLEPVSPDGWRGFVARSYNRNGRDFAFALDEGGATVGMLMSHWAEPDTRSLRIIVHPHHRRRGVGTRLLRVVEGQSGAVEQANCMGRWKAGAAFLERFGFRAEARSLDMARTGPAPAAVSPPPGVTLRPYDASPRDDAAWIALTEDGYRGTPGYTPLAADDLKGHRAADGFHLWLAERAGRIVGLCHTFLWQGDRPHVDSVVVGTPERGRGLGRALFVAGVRTLAAAGHDRVELNVRGDNEPALKIYRDLGFETVDEMVTYRRHRR